MTTELAVNSIINEDHIKSINPMINQMKALLDENGTIEEYRVDTQYFNTESVVLIYPGDVRMTVSIRRPKS